MKLIVNTESTSLERMIIIGGSARSGTTIMGKLIHSLQNVEYYFEPPMLTSILLKKNQLDEASLKELLHFYFYDNFLVDCIAGRNLNLNPNDDSYIFNVKSREEIQERYNKSYGRVELEALMNRTHLSFKLPEVVFFLDTLNTLYPKNKAILMHRNPNDVINSIMRKKWFSDTYLNVNHPSQIYPVQIKDNIKIPFWIKKEDINFWVTASELDRCAYYYQRISLKILEQENNAMIIDYDQFIQYPNEVLNIIVEKYDLSITDKTKHILESISFQEKERKNYLDKMSSDLKEDILNLDMKLKKLGKLIC